MLVTEKKGGKPKDIKRRYKPIRQDCWLAVDIRFYFLFLFFSLYIILFYLLLYSARLLLVQFDDVLFFHFCIAAV